MRHTYRLTDETRKTLTGIVQDVAEEMEVTDKAIYAILSETQTDPFAKFFTLYRAVVRAGGDTGLWDDKLRATRTTRKGDECLRVCLSEKIQRDANTNAQMVDALSDGEITLREAARIQRAIREERKVLKRIEEHTLEVLLNGGNHI